jgi:predicted RNA-binding protein YlqC (UPF0109 family)
VKKKPADQQVEFLREIVRICVCGVAEHEDQVRIEYDVLPARIVFSIFVAHTDVGLVLGKAGETIDSVRRILWTACKKTIYMADLDVITGGSRMDESRGTVVGRNRG